ncbi:MAG: DUF2218 domain-containing protein [Pseudomonadota bacterium]|nr:DUF2218 domain-containing protein [Pseudomonadota bacterium]
MISTATISTVEPARIILRLCKHWGHKFAVAHDDTQGRIELPLGVCLLRAGEGQLIARLEGVPGADMARFEQVVAEHAQRMARGETYDWSWTRTAPTSLVLRMHAGETTVRWAPGPAGALALPITLDGLAATLRHAPPTPGEIEYAIEQVEDAIMPARAHLPAGALALVSGDAALHTLARHARPDAPAPSDAPGPWLSMDAVEHLFNRLAARASGRSATQDALPTDAAHAARLILLRELLHHWGLEGIMLAPEAP